MNDQYNESKDEEDLFHKSTIETHKKENQIRSDQLWAYLLSKSTTLCSEIKKSSCLCLFDSLLECIC